MEFVTRSGEIIEYDPFIQESINEAKAKAPGEGIGPAVTEALINEIRSGEKTDSSQLPEEYRHLGNYIWKR